MDGGLQVTNSVGPFSTFPRIMRESSISFEYGQPNHVCAKVTNPLEEKSIRILSKNIHECENECSHFVLVFTI